MAYPPLHPASSDRRTSYTRAEFCAAYPDEDGHIEFKSNASKEALQRPLVGFSNSSGGVILIGVDDHGQTLHRGRTSAWEDGLHQAASAARDIGRYTCHKVVVDNHEVLAVSVGARATGFAQTSAGVVLQRRGKNNLPLYGSDLSSFLLERGRDRFERQPSGYTLSDVDSDLLNGLCAIKGWSLDATDLDDRLRGRGMLMDAPSNELTVAGALFLVSDNSGRLGKAQIEVLRFPNEGGPIDRRNVFNGPVPHQVSQVTKHLMEELGVDYVVSGLYRYELPRLPEQVLREAIANAVAHRSYEASGTSVVVELRPGYVVIRSPGGLVEPVTEQNIRETNAARNVDVIDLLRSYRLAEDQGLGVDLMQDQMMAHLLDPPTFKDLGHALEVTLPIQSPVSPQERAWIMEVEQQGRLEPQDRVLLVHAARGEQLKNSDARDYLRVDAAQARLTLRRLVDVGLLNRVGDRGGTHYVLSQELRSPAAFRMSPNELLELVLGAAREGALTNRKVREVTGLSREEALEVLDLLVRSGRLLRRGERRGTHYILDPQHPKD
jgi:ATP-dependent DNA helicase RecG